MMQCHSAARRSSLSRLEDVLGRIVYALYRVHNPRGSAHTAHVRAPRHGQGSHRLDGKSCAWVASRRLSAGGRARD
eukprot:2867102-Prymnesium_polylepis.1